MSQRKKSIIIADDSKIFTMYFGILLKRMGFDVIPVENGLEALKLIKVMEPNLVIFDIHMPVMDGITALRLIKQDKRISEIPVVMVTTESNKESIERCENLGCSGYITKPINIDRVHEVLQEHLYVSQGFKRKHIRTSFSKKVSIIHNGTTYKFYAVNLSAGGIYITTIDPFPIGSKVKINLYLDDEQTLSLDASVVYSKNLYGDSFKNPPGMALEFQNLTTNDSAILNNYIKKSISEDILDSQEEEVIEIR
jgi:CheY-like chemotaxis protein/Tfp pilus assembly protein PilZ